MDEIQSIIEEEELNLEDQLDALKEIEQLKRDRDEYLRLKIANSPASILISRKEHENNKKNLKSDLKKTTSFVKKIKTITAEGLQQCIREVEQLNLTLYISEIVSAILETTYKPSDMPNLIKLCVFLHRKYEEFTQPLLIGIRTFLVSQNIDEDPQFGKKKRICIRLIIELFKEGVVINENYFVELLKSLLGKSNKHNAPADYLGLSTYLKYGTELLFGFPSKKMIELSVRSGVSIEELPYVKITSGRVSNELRTMVDVACEEVIFILYLY
jgi:regulator of nonsense transcripts 2